MTAEGEAEMDDLEAEFTPRGWTFGSTSQEAASGPGGYILLAWRDGVTVSAQTVSGLRRKLREQG